MLNVISDDIISIKSVDLNIRFKSKFNNESRNESCKKLS